MLSSQMRELERQHEVVTYTIKASTEAWVANVNIELIEAYRARFAGVNAPTLSIQYGNKFAKIMAGTTVWGFVAQVAGNIGGIPYAIGDLLKPATWRAPAKHSRGNILDGTAQYGMYGPNYLK
jgi:hypothetical protein